MGSRCNIRLPSIHTYAGEHEVLHTRCGRGEGVIPRRPLAHRFQQTYYSMRKPRLYICVERSDKTCMAKTVALFQLVSRRPTEARIMAQSCVMKDEHRQNCVARVGGQSCLSLMMQSSAQHLWPLVIELMPCTVTIHDTKRDIQPAGKDGSAHLPRCRVVYPMSGQLARICSI
ncbi:hypothetical protein BC835DRAFT_870710 [Cytidiella melzeri]|nr:hypothetical protein BC835DRAFT_870710 [Cytidiella melzeri]